MIYFLKQNIIVDIFFLVINFNSFIKKIIDNLIIKVFLLLNLNLHTCIHTII